MEELREENHRLMLKLENMKKTHSTEVEDLREELELREREYKQQLLKVQHDAKGREELKNEKIQVLTEELQSLRDDHDSLLQHNEKLRTQLEILKNAKTTGGGGSYSDYEGLKESNKILKSQLAEKEELLTSQTEKIRGLSGEVRECKEVIARLNEEVEGKDSVVKELHERVKAVEREKEEECGGLQHEVLGLREEVRRLNESLGGGGSGGSNDQTQQGAGGTRGNSLFSEVEERRLKVENELTRLRNLVKKLTEEKRVLQLELERGDTHSATITTQLELIQKNQSDLIMEIKKDKSETLQLFDSYRDRLDFLRDEYSRKLQQYKNNPNALPTATELETLRSERDKLQFVKIALERENNELNRDLKYNKRLRTNAECNVKILKSKLEFLKHTTTQNSNINTTDDTTTTQVPIYHHNNKNDNNMNTSSCMTNDDDTSTLEPATSLVKIKKPQSEQCNQQ